MNFAVITTVIIKRVHCNKCLGDNFDDFLFATPAAGQ